MAYSQTDLDAIEEAIASGALKVKYADKEVTYRSLDEMMKVRDLIRRKLGATSISGNLNPVYSKGLDR